MTRNEAADAPEATKAADAADAADAAAEAPHPTSTLNDLVHQKARLGILAVLAEVDRAEFGYLKSLLQLTDGNLGRHIEVLAGSGLLHVEKGYSGRRPRTWVTITRTGRHALEDEMGAIRELLRRFDGSS